MRLDIHLHHHADPVDTRVIDKLDLQLAYLENIMDALDRIEAAAARQTTLEDSLAAMVTDIKNQLAEALAGTKLPAEVEARLAAIFPTLEANNDRLTSILTANTAAAPAAPEPSTADTDALKMQGVPKSMGAAAASQSGTTTVPSES